MTYSLPSLPDDAFHLEEPRIKYISRQAKGVYANILLDDLFKRTFAELRQEIFELLFETAEIATFTPEDKVKYEFNMTTERNIRNQIRFAEKQAAAKAEAKAEAKIEAKVAEQVRKARMEDSIKTARLMLADHKPMAEIVKYSGLTEEQVRAL